MPDAGGNGAARVVVLVGLLLVAVNLRPPITSVPPVLETIRADLALSYATVSLLTVIPILCMSVFALTTPWFVHHVGRERTILWAVTLVGVSTFARVYGDQWGILLGTTLLVGIAIAVSQTILPSIVSAYFPGEIAFATGLYTAALALGAALGSLFTVPIQAAVGAWTLALGGWGLLGVVGVIAWLPITRRPKATQDPAVNPGTESLIRLPLSRPLSWGLTVFHGIVASIFFMTVTWLPARYVAVGWSESRAGLLLSVFIITGLGGMLSIAAFGDRSSDRRGWIWGMLACVVLGVVPIGMAPFWFPWITTTVFGIGSGGLFTLALMLPADYGVDATATDRLSAMVFAGGYFVAATGPYAFGLLLDLDIMYSTLFSSFGVAALGAGALAAWFSPGRDRISLGG